MNNNLYDVFFDTFGLDIESDLEIDLLDLHNEWMLQPNLYIKYATLCAKTKKERSELYAKTNKDIRTVLLEEKGKIVEATVKSMLDSDKNVIRMDYKVMLIEVALKAIEMRKHSLENEVKLYCGEYFSIPKENNIVKRKKKSPNKEAEEKAEKGVFNSKKRRE